MFLCRILVARRFAWFNQLVDFLLLYAGGYGELRTVPEHSIVFDGQPARFNCSSSLGATDIVWNSNGSAVASTCRSQYPRKFTDECDLTTNRSDLIVISATIASSYDWEDFVCTDSDPGDPGTKAYLIVLSEYFVSGTAD